VCWLYGGAKDVIAGQTPKMKGMDLDEAQASVELLAEEFAISKAKMQVGPVGGPARAPSLSLRMVPLLPCAVVCSPRLSPTHLPQPPRQTVHVNAIFPIALPDRLLLENSFETRLVVERRPTGPAPPRQVWPRIQELVEEIPEVDLPLPLQAKVQPPRR
jgi:hypothetical protein